MTDLKKDIMESPTFLGNAQKYVIIRRKKNYFLNKKVVLNILCSKTYFLAKKSFTFEGSMIDSTKV
jgi:hypothetical protein